MMNPFPGPPQSNLGMPFNPPPSAFDQQQSFQNSPPSNFSGQGMQDVPLPPNSEVGHNILRGMAMMTGPPNPANAPPQQGNLQTSIVTQHLYRDPSPPSSHTQFPARGDQPSMFAGPPPIFPSVGGPPVDAPPQQLNSQVAPFPSGTGTIYPANVPGMPTTMGPPLTGPPAIRPITTSEVYYSRNLNQIAEEIRQSQVRSSRMAPLATSIHSRPGMPQSGIVPGVPMGQTSTITTTTVVAPLPVDELEREKRLQFCKCPRWFCAIFILLLLLLLVALFYLLFSFNGWGLGLWKTFDKACPAGSNPYGDKCLVCPKGARWDGKECVTAESSGSIDSFSLVGVDEPIIQETNKQGQCDKGFTKYKGKCVKCPNTSTWNGTECDVNRHFPENITEEIPKTRKEETRRPIVPTAPKLPVPAHPVEKTVPVEPMRKEPIKRQVVVPEPKIGHCQPGYVYHRTGCVPLIGHNSVLRHLRPRTHE